MRFMTNATLAVAFATAAVAITPTSAQPLPPAAQTRVGQAVNLAKAGCSREIKTYCSRVKEGPGRLAACLYAFSDKMSDRCADAIIKETVRLNAALTALNNAVAACEGDTKRLCNGVAPGNGNLLGCLTKARQSVSAPCNVAIDAAAMR